MNFEQLNPGKTLFRKNFGLFAKVDSEADRFLEFERWWSGYCFMNENEISPGSSKISSSETGLPGAKHS